MWITQTYLGAIEPEAKLFVYYFFEDYAPKQKEFTEQVQIELERLGEAFGNKVSLFMPNSKYAGRIEAEVRENRQLWESLHGNFPGLFISKMPLAQIKPTDDECIYIPFETQHPDKAAEVIQRVRRIANETLHWDHINNSSSSKKSFDDTFFDALELKPGIFGFRIDLKKLARR